jgi:hypothetical protein
LTKEVWRGKVLKSNHALKELRRCQYDYLLALHILLLIVKGKSPSAIADFLLCSRSSVYAIEAWWEGKLQEQWWSAAPESETQRIASLTPLRFMLLWVFKLAIQSSEHSAMFTTNALAIIGGKCPHWLICQTTFSPKWT